MVIAERIDIFPTDSYILIDQRLSFPVKLLRQGDIVAIPTETVYGLAANAFSSEAVTKIFQAKGRPMDNPLIVHVSDLDMLARVVDHIPVVYEPLMHRFWPGPITFLFPKVRLYFNKASYIINHASYMNTN